MSTRIAILCPGQGGQHPGMFELASSSPAAAEAIKNWPLEAVIGMPLENLWREPAALYSNRVAQPLVVAATLALWQAVRHALPSPALVAGYSVGELAAYAVASALPAPDAIRLAAVRAALMDACVQPGNPQGMLALSGLNKQAMRTILPAGLYSAIETGESSFIVGGLRHAMPLLQREALSRGGHVRKLPIEVASHTPFMHEAAQGFREELQRSSFSNPSFPVLSGAEAEPTIFREQAIVALATQTERTIRWAACMDAIAEAGVTVALELGSCSALSRMLRDRHPRIHCRSTSEFRSFAGLESWIGRHI